MMPVFAVLMLGGITLILIVIAALSSLETE